MNGWKRVAVAACASGSLGYVLGQSEPARQLWSPPVVHAQEKKTAEPSFKMVERIVREPKWKGFKQPGTLHSGIKAEYVFAHQKKKCWGTP